MASIPPALGFGLSYRFAFGESLLGAEKQIDLLELIGDHFLPLTAASVEAARNLASAFPCVTHTLESSVGSSDPLNVRYLDDLCALLEIVDAPWFSDHLCMSSAGSMRLNSLIPIRRTRDVARAVAKKAKTIQAAAGRPFLIENISATMDVGGDMPEADFVTEILERADCFLLLDLANFYNNSVNFRFDPIAELDRWPLSRVVQIHLAGGRTSRGFRYDTHDTPVCSQVLDLLEYVTQKVEVQGIVLERDGDLPSDIAPLVAELNAARAVVNAER